MFIFLLICHLLSSHSLRSPCFYTRIVICLLHVKYIHFARGCLRKEIFQLQLQQFASVSGTRNMKSTYNKPMWDKQIEVFSCRMNEKKISLTVMYTFAWVDLIRDVTWYYVRQTKSSSSTRGTMATYNKKFMKR